MFTGLLKYILPTAGAVGILLAGALWVQTQRLESAQRQLYETRQQLEMSKRVIVQLERDAAEQERRTEIRQRAREDIITMPEADRKKPLGDIWRRAFRAADEIGGVE